jgi:putative alpha-1,2-mannosidase
MQKDFENKIRGFQQSHQCSSWVNDYAVFSLMPVTGKLVVTDQDRATAFSHKNEIAKPNYRPRYEWFCRTRNRDQ